MANSFIKFIRSEESLELLIKEPNAFLLLSLIAYRARRNDKFNAKNLGPGEALIGDDNSCGLTSQMYRTAKEKLEKWNFATFTTTNRGTIAKIVDTRVWDINCDDAIKLDNKLNDSQATVKQQAGNKLATTNKEAKKERIEEDKEQQQAAAEPPNAAASFDPEKAKHLVKQAMLSWGLTEIEFNKHRKTYGISRLFAALQFISEPGFIVRETEIQAFFWCVKAQPWLEKKNQPVKMSNKERVEQYFVDGQIYNGAQCGINANGIWFHRGAKAQGAKFEAKTFAVELANALETFGIEDPLKKTFNIKEA